MDIPSKAKVIERMNGKSSEKAQAVIARLTKAVETADKIPVTVQCERGDSAVQQAVAEAFRAKGWAVNIISDQRDGDYWRLD